MKSQLGDLMGTSLECEHANPDNGDTLLQTTAGLGYYREHTNTPMFTDGWKHWAWTEIGIVEWEGHNSHPPIAPETLSIDAIFDGQRANVSGIMPERLHTLIVTGDVGLVRMVNLTTTNARDFVWPFRQIGGLLRDGDITLVNLEGPLLPGCPQRTISLVFCGDPRNVQALEYAGVDIAAVANNHMLDHGQTGRDATREVLENGSILHAGCGVTAIRIAGNVRFGFLSFNFVGTNGDVEDMVSEIKALRDDVDVLVVSPHWGTEYVRTPSPAPGIPGARRDIGRAAIDAGANLVVGNHPHWYQGVEFYRGRLIAYAHGNFVFDQRWSDETLRGVVGINTFYDDILLDVEYVPIHIDSWGQPHPADDDEKSLILDAMRSAS